MKRKYVYLTHVITHFQLAFSIKNKNKREIDKSKLCEQNRTVFFSLGAFRAPASTNCTMHQQQKVIKLSITFPLARRKNKERLHIASEHKTRNQWINLGSTSLQTALRSLNTSPSDCIEHMRSNPSTVNFLTIVGHQ